MNSLERRELRYQRRKKRRNDKRLDFIKSLGSFEDIFSYENLYNSFDLCKKSVRWKASIQSYEANLPINTYSIYKGLKEGVWKSKGFTKFTLCERGKVRIIQSVHISERCIQRTFCDNYLVPILSRSLIYDNGASLAGKGIDFSINRLKKHLRLYSNRYGNDGYIVIFDFSNYFGNINHNELFDLVDHNFVDDRLRKLYHQLVNSFEQGLGLGSQVSQISAVSFANCIDHFFKDMLGIKFYGRYMDDTYILERDKRKVQVYINYMKAWCERLGIVLKDSKIKILKIRNGFTYLKKRFKVNPQGHITIRLSRKVIIACKRRLLKMREKLLSKKLTFKEIFSSYKSWREGVRKYKTKKVIGKMDKFFDKLFIEPFILGIDY